MSLLQKLTIWQGGHIDPPPWNKLDLDVPWNRVDKFEFKVRTDPMIRSGPKTDQALTGFFHDLTLWNTWNAIALKLSRDEIDVMSDLRFFVETLTLEFPVLWTRCVISWPLHYMSHFSSFSCVFNWILWTNFHILKALGSFFVLRTNFRRSSNQSETLFSIL